MFADTSWLSSRENSMSSGKSVVAPVKVVTVPRVELSFAVLAVRLNRFIRYQPEYTLWTKCSTALQYVYNISKRFHTFVDNRLTEINEFYSRPMRIC